MKRTWKKELRRDNRPTIENLESRVVLTTFHAATPTQLLADIAAVNNSGGTNTIILKPGAYVFSYGMKINNPGNLTIRPSSTSSPTSLVGSVVDRVLEIQGGNVTLSGLYISGGGNVSLGGGILAQNTNLTLRNTRVTGNISSQAGAGIYIQGGSLTLQNSAVNNNRSSNTATAYGGGIAALGTKVTLTNTTVSENSLYAVDLSNMNVVNATGGGIFAEGGSLNITGSTLSGNSIYSVTTGRSASSLGGAVSTYQTPVNVSSSTLQYNSLNTVSYGSATTQGSVFYTNGGSLRIVSSKMGQSTPGGTSSIAHPGATVTIIDLNLDGKTISGVLSS